MGLIDADAAAEIVRFECGKWEGLANTIIKEFYALKPLDAVPVRCKDCKFFSHGYCRFHDAKFVRSDGYCYWGEQKEGDQHD